MANNQTQLQFIAKVAPSHRETFTLPSTFLNVDGNISTLQVSNYTGVYTVDIQKGSDARQCSLHGTGWQNLIQHSFGHRLLYLHLVKHQGEILYVSGFDTNGLEITGEGNVKKHKNTRYIMVLNDFPSGEQIVNHDFMRQCLMENEESQTKLRIEDMEWRVNVYFAIDPKTGVITRAALTGCTWDFFCTYHDLQGGEYVIMEHYAPGYIDFAIVAPEDVLM